MTAERMARPFLATLIEDVIYLDFEGHRRVVKAGTVVSVVEVRSAISNSFVGTFSKERGSYIATDGDISFDVRREQFTTRE